MKGLKIVKTCEGQIAELHLGNLCNKCKRPCNCICNVFLAKLHLLHLSAEHCSEDLRRIFELDMSDIRFNRVNYSY